MFPEITSFFKLNIVEKSNNISILGYLELYFKSSNLTCHTTWPRSDYLYMWHVYLLKLSADPGDFGLFNNLQIRSQSRSDFCPNLLHSLYFVLMFHLTVLFDKYTKWLILVSQLKVHSVDNTRRFRIIRASVEGVLCSFWMLRRFLAVLRVNLCSSFHTYLMWTQALLNKIIYNVPSDSRKLVP